MRASIGFRESSRTPVQDATFGVHRISRRRRRRSLLALVVSRELWLSCLFLSTISHAHATSKLYNGKVVVERRGGDVCFRIESYEEWNLRLFPREYNVDDGDVVISDIKVDGMGGAPVFWVSGADRPMPMRSRDAICYGAAPPGFRNDVDPALLTAGKYRVHLEGLDTRTHLDTRFLSAFCVAKDGENSAVVDCDPSLWTRLIPGLQELFSK